MKRKNILITGASSGLGKGMARKFTKQGCNLALCTRRTDKLKILQTELKQQHPNVKFLFAHWMSTIRMVFLKYSVLSDETSNGSLDRIIVNGIGRGGSLGKGLAKPNRETAMTNFERHYPMEAALEIFREQTMGIWCRFFHVRFRGYPGAMNVYRNQSGFKEPVEERGLKCTNRLQ